MRIGCVTATDAGASTELFLAQRKIAKRDQVGDRVFLS